MKSSVANRDILAIGTSADGVDALRQLAREFPPARDSIRRVDEIAAQLVQD